MAKLTELVVTPRCSTCGIVMYVPEWERVFICDNPDCNDNNKYKIPTIELEFLGKYDKTN